LTASQKQSELKKVKKCSAFLRAYGLTKAAYSYCNGACLDMCGSDSTCSARCPAVGTLISTSELLDTLEFLTMEVDPAVTRK